MLVLTQQRLFQSATLVAISGWLVLVGLPYWSGGPRFVLAIAIVLLCVLYAVALYQAMTDRTGTGKPGFFTLQGVLALFRNPKAVLAGWVHILSFDLLAGLYIHQQGAAQSIHHFWLVPCYLLAMMFGPLGLLLFLAISLLHGL
ncbi:abscisic acid-deficient protein Aba4 family protein [Pseudomonas sp.]|uniref:abscisic acid-deficient protein Aba4 family protein n=1 Tax=Pseudomonas sp. TaxID=306 RepID=UPI00356646AF